MKDLNILKNRRKERRVARVRSKISGTPDCPRLAVFKSLKYVSVQAIDDVNGKTLAEARDSEVKKSTKLEQAKSVGKLIAKKLVEKKVEKAIFDKRHYKYHGVVKELADGARDGGLKF